MKAILTCQIPPWRKVAAKDNSFELHYLVGSGTLATHMYKLPCDATSYSDVSKIRKQDVERNKRGNNNSGRRVIDLALILGSVDCQADTRPGINGDEIMEPVVGCLSNNTANGTLAPEADECARQQHAKTPPHPVGNDSILTRSQSTACASHITTCIAITALAT